MTGPAHHGDGGGQLPPSRRAVLRGAAAVTLATAVTTAAGAATASAAGAAAPPAAVDHPGAQWLPADPACYRAARRPDSGPVGYVVIHVTQATFDDAVAVFRDPGRKTSAHYLVRSADGRIGQCVREKDIAWHTGRPDYDDRSIGITHEGWVDSDAWFTEEMYAASAALTADVCARHAIPLSRTHILGHHEVPGVTHTDPGANWDWDRYLELVRKASATR
ncbi:N-acetylmuramoyl-L-alanine amidase [Actinacidiphila acidipaludis]|uniref:N-acetylmuramoyl-L-alanine amidase n=1 Tax=Actinacidiphila acidipaludis TaxID=2873382 RepID=A0ABS7PZU9_9ACTN|nr:N-acetylmuramoyl-L-alanine amidase [Streptomyces acidipaludis]MBY8876273.1 N-acetylmuramoyl-L-alanine amidase [Streptomyces acidipaludis]